MSKSITTSNDILDQRQSDLRSLHSTVTALLDLTNQWCFNIDGGLFNTVDHELLVTKLEYIRVLGGMP